MDKGKRLVALIPYLLFAVVSALDDERHKNGSHHFVLVHGACLGAWSWYKMVPLLESAGHRVTTIDLGASGINLVSVNEIESFSDYSKPLMDLMASLPQDERVILVGHSLGGASISQAMEIFPEKVVVAVFLTAAMPNPASSFSEFLQTVQSDVLSALDNIVTYSNGPNNLPTTFTFGPKYLSQVVYQYSPAQDVALAILVARPLRLVSGEELVFTEAKYGSVKRVFIVAEEDQVLPIDVQKFMIKQDPPDMVLTINGCDHMAMISQPIKLLAHLLRISEDFA